MVKTLQLRTEQVTIFIQIIQNH